MLVSVGVRPASTLATAAGVEVGERGAIRVGRGMQTNLSAVYAAGDCVETWHRVLGEHRYLPLGTTSHKQGRVAGENAAGGQAEFQGSLGTQVVKIFTLAVARTGLRDDEARQAGFDPVTTETSAWDHKSYYPGAHELRIRVTGDRTSGRLLGAQILGHWQAGVAKRIGVLATALFHEMTVDAINDVDLSYTPPFSAPWDPVQVAAQDWRAACLASSWEPAVREVDGVRRGQRRRPEVHPESPERLTTHRVVHELVHKPLVGRRVTSPAPECTSARRQAPHSTELCRRIARSSS